MKNMGIYANKHKKRTEANITYYATWSSLEMSTTIFIKELLLVYEYKGSHSQRKMYTVDYHDLYLRVAIKVLTMMSQESRGGV